MGLLFEALLTESTLVRFLSCVYPFMSDFLKLSFERFETHCTLPWFVDCLPVTSWDDCNSNLIDNACLVIHFGLFQGIFLGRLGSVALFGEDYVSTNKVLEQECTCVKTSSLKMLLQF